MKKHPCPPTRGVFLVFVCNLAAVMRHMTMQNALLYQIIRFVIFVIK